MTLLDRFAFGKLSAPVTESRRMAVPHPCLHFLAGPGGRAACLPAPQDSEEESQPITKCPGSSCCGITGPTAALQGQGTGSIPGPAQWVKALVLLQLRCRLQRWLGSDPWPKNSVCCRGGNPAPRAPKCSEGTSYTGPRQRASMTRWSQERVSEQASEWESRAREPGARAAFG